MEPATATEESIEAPAAAGSPGADAPETFEVHRPTDGSLIRTVEIDTPQQVAETVARVRAAQPAWEAMGFEERYAWLGRLRDWMFEHSETIADLMQSETGKVRADAALEAPFICDAINFWGKRAEGMLADETPVSHNPLFRVKKLKIAYRPFPVVGVISPWNFPLILSFDDAIPALMAGAAVVIKPSEVTPLVTNEIVRAWKEEIRGPDVLDVVNGMGDTGGALVDHSDFIQFTGSDKTGKIVMKRAADTLTPVSLELGGKDPMIVLRDANLERAINAAAYGGLANTGQICMSIERVYVEEPLYEPFVQGLAKRVGELRQGTDGRDYQQDLGAMTFPAQLEKVAGHVEDAREKGARILTGGRKGEGPGDWYEPTVVADADHTMDVMVDETFGPVLGVMKVARRRGGDRDGQRHPLRALCLGHVEGHQARRGCRPPARVRRGQHRRRPHQLLPHRPADGRLEGIRDRDPARRLWDQALLPLGGDRRPADPPGQARPALVPAPPRREAGDDEAVPRAQRTRFA